ncbi:MAG: 16S rRNA (guanine(527)-N(7))-methyltransferase RsmG, partial [Planctomycetota bacterium]
MVDQEQSSDRGSPDLPAALAEIGLELPAEVVERLDAYRRLLWERNQTINLTRHTTFDLFARRDVYDAWQLAQLLQEGEDVLD